MSTTAVMNPEMNVATETNSSQTPPPVSTETVGRSLKAAREERNMSLDEASRATKIRKEFLLAIEEDRFEMLPGDVFARGFVRSYADFLGLDGKAIAGRAAVPDSKSLAVAGEKSGKRGTSMLRVVGLGIVGAAAAAVWYFQAHGGL